MDSEARNNDRTNTLYSRQDLHNANRELKRRWLHVAIPCVLLLAVLVCSLVIRLEWLTSAATIAMGAILIFFYDMYVKPVVCYRRHLRNVLEGRVRTSELPFVALSEDVSVVDGVQYRAMTCQDVDGKGREYDRLFYFDCEKPFPDFRKGDLLRVVHHDLIVADVTRI